MTPRRGRIFPGMTSEKSRNAALAVLAIFVVVMCVLYLRERSRNTALQTANSPAPQPPLVLVVNLFTAPAIPEEAPSVPEASPSPSPAYCLTDMLKPVRG